MALSKTKRVNGARVKVVRNFRDCRRCCIEIGPNGIYTMKMLFALTTSSSRLISGKEL